MELLIEELQLLAYRARLTLTDDELCKYCKDLGALEELSAALLPYSDAVFDRDLPHGLSEMREDVERTSFSRDEMLCQASVREGEYIAVPCVVEDS